MDPRNAHGTTDIETGRIRPGPYGLDMFAKEVDHVKEDMKSLEKLYCSVREINEDVKIAQNAMTMRDLRDRMNTDRITFSSRLSGSIRNLMSLFGLMRPRREGPNGNRAQATHREQVFRNHAREGNSRSHRQFNRERSPRESPPPRHAGPRPWPVLDKVAEIRAARHHDGDSPSLMSPHCILLGIATPSGGGAAGGGTICWPEQRRRTASPRREFFLRGCGGGGRGGKWGLNDYEKETRKQAHIAIAVALVIIISIIVSLLKVENQVFFFFF
ncbi:hypothetical protein DH2020_007654 [Rehmannia glutinosa]|uniref:Uncharacterized protein n=1 Tax=Rehmannia glutinosa TaxID=99300 RepID=A0ABR0TYQ9_REHGL